MPILSKSHFRHAIAVRNRDCAVCVYRPCVGVCLSYHLFVLLLDFRSEEGACFPNNPHTMSPSSSIVLKHRWAKREKEASCSLCFLSLSALDVWKIYKTTQKIKHPLDPYKHKKSRRQGKRKRAKWYRNRENIFVMPAKKAIHRKKTGKEDAESKR